MGFFKGILQGFLTVFWLKNDISEILGEIVFLEHLFLAVVKAHILNFKAWQLRKCKIRFYKRH